MDKYGCISHRLYRQHCTQDEQSHYKDLDKLGRDLSKIIIVDNSPHNFKYNIDNGIMIKTWKDDTSDEQLKGLGRLLIRIAQKQYPDFRKVIRTINEYLDRSTIKSMDNPYDQINLDTINN
jgi:TFIIF-interacting CTD phosphatase-like protein